MMDLNNCSTGIDGSQQRPCGDGGQWMTGSTLDLGRKSLNQSCNLLWSSMGFHYECTSSSQADPELPETGGADPLITNETKRLLELIITINLLMLTSLFGIVGNVVNIIVYWRQGLSDSITVGFFALSVSDLFLVLMPFLTGATYAFKYAWPDSVVDFSSIHYASFGWVRNFMYSSSCLITTFLALERCCCVIVPFKVTQLFTRTKTTIFLIIVVVFHVACTALLPAAIQLRWQTGSHAGRQNGTKILRLWFSEYREEIEMFYSTVMSFMVPVGTQVVVIVCAFIMVHGLRRASKFRAVAKGKISPVIDQENTSSITPTGELTKSSSEKNKQGSHQATLSPRDARLVRTMVFLVSILSACNIPFLVATFAWKTIPDLNIGKPYQNMLSVLFSIVYLLGSINASSSIIVYYKSSSRFRATARDVFWSKAK